MFPETECRMESPITTFSPDQDKTTETESPTGRHSQTDTVRMYSKKVGVRRTNKNMQTESENLEFNTKSCITETICSDNEKHYQVEPMGMLVLCFFSSFTSNSVSVTIDI